MKRISQALLLLSMLLPCILVLSSYLGVNPSGCDEAAALQCEYEFLQCKLFTGPANDPVTLCNCASSFYGDCLRQAGCETANEVGPLTGNEIYMKTCVDFIIENDCPNPLMCSINCASDASIDTASTKIIPFNNYGQYYLRVRTCLRKIHQQKQERYATIIQTSCDALEDFEVCSRWIPPSTFVPVALPINTTYIEIDSCEITTNGFGNNTYVCRTSDPAPSRVYGNRFLFPRSYDVVQTNISTCAVDTDCLGSFCDTQFRPPVCSPKTIGQALGTGATYLTLGI